MFDKIRHTAAEQLEPEVLGKKAAQAAARGKDAAVHAKEWGEPKVESFLEWFVPRLEKAYQDGVKAAAPRVEKAAAKATPVIDTAHDKVVDDLLPKLVAAVNAAATSADATADKIAKAAHEAAVKAEKEQKSGNGAKVFWISAAAAAGVAAFVAWRRSQPQHDPWAEPWDAEDDDFTAEIKDSVGGAAETLGEVAGAAVAKGREATSKAAELADEARDKVKQAASRRKPALEDAADEAKEAAKHAKAAGAETKEAASEATEDAVDAVAETAEELNKK